MKLIIIDEDELEPDSEWNEYADDYIAYSSTQIQAAKVADAIPVIHAEWIPRDDSFFKGCISECSNCHKRYYLGNIGYNYCPECGARMDGEKRI